MNILIFRPRASQMLLLVLLVQVVLIVLVYFNKSWTSSLNLFPDLEHEDKIEKYKNIFTKYLAVDDEKKLVNLDHFDYKIINEYSCQNNNVLLLVAVSSAPENKLRRNVIRETWGQSDSEVKIVFILGDSAEPNDTKSLQIEDMTFHDIVQGNFLDTYKNMTYKSTMSLKYAIYNCPTSKFILKCDDDVFVNMPLLKNFLKNDMNVMNTKNRVFCTVNYARTPIRDPTGFFRKWYVSYEEWPEEKFPMYCSGWFFISSLDVAFNIYQHAQNSTFFWIDDVFLTGIAAKNVYGLQYVDITKFTLTYTGIENILNGDLGDTPFLVGAMNMAPEHIRILWQYVLSRPVQESILNGTDFEVT